MKLVRHGDTHGALMGDVLTLVHGTAAFHLPATALADLRAVLASLSAGTAAVAPTPVIETSDAKPASRRRGRLWEAVAQHLQQAGRARGFGSLLRFVKEHELTDRNPEHALKIALGKKVSSGELVLTASRRYRLPEPGASAPSPASAVRAPGRSQKGQRQKSLPKISLRDYILSDLAEHPGGRSIEELTDSAIGNKWTGAKNPGLAVKISVGKMSSVVELGEDGRCRLRGQLPDAPDAAPATAKSVVRRRRGKIVSKA